MVHELPQASISIYQEIVKKLVSQFAASTHYKIFTTNLFNTWQGPSESLREYLARLNEATIRVVHLNQEMFEWVFQNGLKSRHF